VTAHRNLIKPLLPAAFYVLLSVLVLPGSNNNFSAKGVCLSDPISSMASLQDNDLGNADGDNQKFSRTPDEMIVVTAAAYSTFSSSPAHGPDVAFTVSQARAPPLC